MKNVFAYLFLLLNLSFVFTEDYQQQMIKKAKVLGCVALTKARLSQDAVILLTLCLK